MAGSRCGNALRGLAGGLEGKEMGGKDRSYTPPLPESHADLLYRIIHKGPGAVVLSDAIQWQAKSTRLPPCRSRARQLSPLLLRFTTLRKPSRKSKKLVERKTLLSKRALRRY